MASTPVGPISPFPKLCITDIPAASLIYASARDHFLPEVFTRLHYRRRTPDNAMALQAALTTFFVVFGGGFRCQLPAPMLCAEHLKLMVS